MDACSYLGHGHVFATAQTGNIVLLALELVAGHVEQAAHHVPPLAAFAAGVIASRMLQARLEAATGSLWIRLSIECAGLTILAFIAGSLPDAVTTACVAFMAAIQLTTFSRVGEWSFNSTITTGNLRDALAALSAAWLDPTDTANRRRAATLGIICASFAAGALAGGFFMMRLGDWTLLITALAVLCAMILSREPAA